MTKTLRSFIPATGASVLVRWLRSLFFRPLEDQVTAIYQDMLLRIQRDMLTLLVSIGCVLAVPFGIQTYVKVWVEHSYPSSVFTIHMIRVGAIVVATVLLLRQNRVRLAWGIMLIISISTTFLIMALIQEPGLIIFILFGTVGPALTMSLRVSLTLTLSIIGATYLVAATTFTPYTTNWVATATVFAGVMIGLSCFGFVIRRFIKQFAIISLENQREAVRRTQAEQRISDLQTQMRQIALLEHDLRQPLKAVQGNLLSLTVDAEEAEELIAPALAAARRAERLVSNLLDYARAEAHQQRLRPVPTNLHMFCDALRAATPGLSRYYTDPPLPITIKLDSGPMVASIDPEQVERAILNLLDNALAYAPPGSVVALRVRRIPGWLSIEIQDEGPGIPPAVIDMLMGKNPPDGEASGRTGFGLVQVKTMAEAHGGSLTFTTGGGTIVSVRLPVEEKA